MSYLFFALVASILYGLDVIITKLLSKYSVNNPWLLNFFWSLFTLLFTLPVAVFYGVTWPTAWGNLVWAGLFYALSNVFYILSLYSLDVSVLSPLFNFRAVFSLILGYLFLGESLNSFQLFLVVLILIGGLLVTLDERWSLKTFLSRGVSLAMLLMVWLSLMAVFINRAVIEVGFWPTTLFMLLIGQAFLLLTLPKFIRSLKIITAPNFLFVGLMGLVSFVATLSVNRAYGVNVGLSTVVISLPISMILAFVLSRVRPELLEKHSLGVYAVRFAAAAVMIVSAVKLSLG